MLYEKLAGARLDLSRNVSIGLGLHHRRRSRCLQGSRTTSTTTERTCVAECGHCSTPGAVEDMDGNCDCDYSNHTAALGQLWPYLQHQSHLIVTRRNYLIVAILSVVVCFLRNPLALAALACCTLGLLCCNDPFATTLK